MGKKYIFQDGVYVLEEITNSQRCSKKRMMIFRPLKVKTLVEDQLYEVYYVMGKGS